MSNVKLITWYGEKDAAKRGPICDEACAYCAKHGNNIVEVTSKKWIVVCFDHRDVRNFTNVDTKESE